MSKVFKCDNCGEVLIILAKGSKVKPNIYAMHESCRVSREIPTNGAEDFARQMHSKQTLGEIFGGKF